MDTEHSAMLKFGKMKKAANAATMTTVQYLSIEKALRMNMGCDIKSSRLLFLLFTQLDFLIVKYKLDYKTEYQ